jgi:hypothetical protein
MNKKKKHTNICTPHCSGIGILILSAINRSSIETFPLFFYSHSIPFDTLMYRDSISFIPMSDLNLNLDKFSKSFIIYIDKKKSGIKCPMKVMYGLITGKKFRHSVAIKSLNKNTLAKIYLKWVFKSSCSIPSLSQDFKWNNYGKRILRRS